MHIHTPSLKLLQTYTPWTEQLEPLALHYTPKTALSTENVCVCVCSWDMWGGTRCIPGEDMRAYYTRKCVACVMKVHLAPVHQFRGYKCFHIQARDRFRWWTRPKWATNAFFISFLKCSLPCWCICSVPFISVLGHLQLVQITLHFGFNLLRAADGWICDDRNDSNANSSHHREVHKKRVSTTHVVL